MPEPALIKEFGLPLQKVKGLTPIAIERVSQSARLPAIVSS